MADAAFTTVAWNHYNSALPDWNDAKVGLIVDGVRTASRVQCDDLTKRNDTCEYVSHADQCQADGFINYLPVTYCQLKSRAAGMTVFV